MTQIGARLQEAGMLDVLAFQFGEPALLAKQTTLPGSRVLKPGAALLVMQQVLAFSGKRDALHVRVQTQAGMTEATLPISMAVSRTISRASVPTVSLIPAMAHASPTITRTGSQCWRRRRARSSRCWTTSLRMRR